MIYAVVTIDTGRLLYVGYNAADAADKLIEGTCHGQAESEPEAIRLALGQAAWFRARQKSRRLWGQEI